MATEADIDRISAEAGSTEDVARLKALHRELIDLAAGWNQAAGATTDATLRDMATEWRDRAVYEAEEIKRRTAQLELDQMDPQYEARKAQRDAAKRAEEDKGKQMLGGLMRGLLGGSGDAGASNPLGSLLGLGGQPEAASAAPAPHPGAQPPGGPGAAPAAAQGAPPAGATTCRACGAGVAQGAKFCGECGAKSGPVTCAGCGVELAPTGKFCMECGAARPA